MIGEGKNLVETLKEYVSVYDSFSEAKRKSYKLEKESKPIEPKPPVLAPKVKEKPLLYVDRGAYIKTIVLYILEIVFLGLLIYSIVAGSGDNLGFLNTIFLMGAPVVSIVMMIVIGIKIKKSNGIKEYKRAKFENRQRSAYNSQHAKEIKEALQEETKRYNDALAEYQEKKKEYDIAIIKYEEEVSKVKELKAFVESLELRLGTYMYSRLGCRDMIVTYSTGKHVFRIRDNNLRDLFNYYIDKNYFADNARMEDLFEDIYSKIYWGTDDNDLVEILEEMKRSATYSVEVNREYDREMVRKLRETQAQRDRCSHCVYDRSCPSSVKDNPNCAAFRPRK